MKNWLLIGIILLFFGTCITPVIAQEAEKSLSTSKGNWLYVGGSGPGNYSKIQNAVDNCSNGDSIYVFNGIYYENIVLLNKSINLIGEDKNHTIIDAGFQHYCLFINSNYVNVSRFTFQNSGSTKIYDAGIAIFYKYYSQTHDITITNNIFRNNTYGIYAWASSNDLIKNNLFINNRKDGIYFEIGDDNNNISENIIVNNTRDGIHIDEDCTNNLILNNHIQSNTASGIYTSGFRTIIRRNNISTSTNGIVLSGEGESQIEMNNISQNDVGVYIEMTGNCLVNNNNFIQNAQHATFTYFLFHRILYPFLVTPQLTKWRNNYWDNHQNGPKIIIGTMQILFIAYPWINFDFSPVNTPYIYSFEYLEEG